MFVTKNSITTHSCWNNQLPFTKDIWKGLQAAYHKKATKSAIWNNTCTSFVWELLWLFRYREKSFFDLRSHLSIESSLFKWHRNATCWQKYDAVFNNKESDFVSLPNLPRYWDLQADFPCNAFMGIAACHHHWNDVTRTSCSLKSPALIIWAQRASNVEKDSMSWRFHDSNGMCCESTLQWRHNEPDGVSNHRPHDCLLNSLFRRRSKTTSKLRVTGLCAGNSPVTGEFPAQRASDVENVSITFDDVIMTSLQHRLDEGSTGLICHLKATWNLVQNKTSM